MKITLLGAAGGIGQSLSLLLKTLLSVGYELALYDIAPSTLGIATDLSHIPTSVSVTGFASDDPSKALEGADIVLISAGIARKPGMDRSDLFNINASIVQNLIDKVADVCPNACIAIITNPVNTIVPIAAKKLQDKGVFNKHKLFGITTLDVLRSNTFVAELKGKKPEEINVNVIGGHSGVTILPLLSQIDGITFTEQEIISLTKRIQNAGTEVVEAKAGAGSATLSMAQAAARFALSLTKALNGEKNIVECAYIQNDNAKTEFFAQPVLLGKHGYETVLPIGELSSFEQQALDNMLDVLVKEIELGKQFNA